MLRRFYDRYIVGTILCLVLFFYMVSIVCSLLYHYAYKTNITLTNIILLLHLNRGQILMYGVGLLTAWVIYYQILSLRKQLKVQALIEYTKMWNSSEMTAKRKDAMNVLKLNKVTAETVDLDRLEHILELLEDFSTLYDAGVLDQELVWNSSFGWYASRYYYYSKTNNSIGAIREKWGFPYNPDMTQFEKLDGLHKIYLDMEVKRRKRSDKNITAEDIKCGYCEDKNKFIHSENTLTPRELATNEATDAEASPTNVKAE